MGRGGAVVDEDPEAVGAGLGGGLEAWDEAWVDAGGFGRGSVGGTVRLDRAGFFLGHRALGPEQGGGTNGHGLWDVADQQQGDGLIGGVVGGDGDGFFLPSRVSATVNSTRTVTVSPGAKDSLLTGAERPSQLGRSDVKRRGCVPELRKATSATVLARPAATRSPAAVPDYDTAASQTTPTKAVRVAARSGGGREVDFLTTDEILF